MPNFAIGAVLDLARERHGLKSDYKLSLYLGIADGSIRNFRHGRSLPDERICKLLAEAAGIDPLILAAQVQAQRSKTDDARSLWEAIAERLQMAGAHALAAVFAVLFAMGIGAQDARAAGPGDVHDSATQGVKSLYIVSSINDVIPTKRQCAVGAASCSSRYHHRP
ncbi:DUF3693 domain-containing protein [Acidovorax delafieldii]|uniref:DUF3693 domain-containing protein n=1 Tax=Acidovorax delafieldii TaxID=47920 RepID=UPI003ECD5F57